MRDLEENEDFTVVAAAKMRVRNAVRADVSRASPYSARRVFCVLPCVERAGKAHLRAAAGGSLEGLMDDYLWVLKKGELDLIRELEPERIQTLDEEQLLDLHRRVRRARNKHVKNYRRKAALNVEELAGRGNAGPKAGKARWRAAAFEEAVAIVSERLSQVAHAQAEALKDDRLTRAMRGRSPGPDPDAPAESGQVANGRVRAHEKTTGGLKRDASSRAQGARRQAKRDNR